MAWTRQRKFCPELTRCKVVNNYADCIAIETPGSKHEQKNNILNILDRFLTTYLTREDNYPSFSGIAYQAQPSGIPLYNKVTGSVKHNGMPFNIDDGITLYAFYDDEIESNCDIELLSTVSENIGPSGGFIELDDASFNFPAGAFTDYNEITINKLDLVCP
jgi:hypothetical protein